MNTTLACQAPFPVCPACGQGVPLPPFAAGHECEISCCCGHAHILTRHRLGHVTSLS